MSIGVRRSFGVLVGIAAGLMAGLAVGAGAAPEGSPRPSDYEIVRTTFHAGERTAEGTARCSSGKLVMGGGARVVTGNGLDYAIVASDPTGPYGWTAAFVRPEEEPPAEEPAEEEPEEDPPLVPGVPATGEDPDQEDGGEEEEAEATKAEFEVSAVCATID